MTSGAGPVAPAGRCSRYVPSSPPAVSATASLDTGAAAPAAHPAEGLAGSDSGATVVDGAGAVVEAAAACRGAACWDVPDAQEASANAAATRTAARTAAPADAGPGDRIRAVNPSRGPGTARASEPPPSRV